MDQGGPGGPWGPKPPLVDQEGFLHFADADWSALLGCPCAVHMVYVLPSRRSQGLPPDERIKINVAPNYHALHWGPPHINGVEFAELDSYDIRGWSAMIY